MKIAVYLGDLSPVRGGGFTFQDEILRALISIENSGKHSFVIYSNSPKEAVGCNQTHLQWQTAHTKWVRLQNWLTVCFEPLPFIADTLHLRSWFERSLRRCGAEVVWFVTPFFQPVDIPYVYTIWDLQHRLQPWFPETSASGRWKFRDTNYQRALSKAALVIVPNSAGKEEVIRFYNMFPERIDCPAASHAILRT